MRIPLLLIFLLASAACDKKPDAPANDAHAAEGPPIPVSTVAAEEKPMPRYLRATGQLAGNQDARVASDVAGKVINAPVERGTSVKAGDMLIQLDSRNAELTHQEAVANVAALEAKLKWSDSELTRNQPLAQAKAIAAMSFERLQVERTATQSELAAAIARRDLAKKAAADCRILAPFSGMVAERAVSVGEFVSPNFPVVRLVQVDVLRLVLNVPETDVGQLKEGQDVEFSVSSHPGETFSGVLKYIGPALREAARDLLVEAKVENADLRLKPGLFAEARIIIGDHPSVSVPTDAIRIEGARRSLFVIKDGRAMEHLVETGEAAHGWTEIRKGAVKGDRVVSKPPPALADGAAVTTN